MRRLVIMFVMALIMMKVLCAHQDYEHLVRNSVYLIHGLDITTELLIKECDIFYAQANTIELTGALCEVLGRLMLLNQLFDYEFLSESIQQDAAFWAYMKARVAHFIERLSEKESDQVIQLAVSQLHVWNGLINRDFLSLIND